MDTRLFLAEPLLRGWVIRERERGPLVRLVQGWRPRGEEVGRGADVPPPVDPRQLLEYYDWLDWQEGGEEKRRLAGDLPTVGDLEYLETVDRLRDAVAGDVRPWRPPSGIMPRWLRGVRDYEAGVFPPLEDRRNLQPTDLPERGGTPLAPRMPQGWMPPAPRPGGLWITPPAPRMPQERVPVEQPPLARTTDMPAPGPVPEWVAELERQQRGTQVASIRLPWGQRGDREEDREQPPAETPPARTPPAETPPAETPPARTPPEPAPKDVEEGRVAVGMTPDYFRSMTRRQYYGPMDEIIVRETLQNSIDATRGDPQGKTTTVWTDSVRRTYRTRDEGTGMLPDVLTQEFAKLGGTRKPEGASGGMGTAKIAFLGNADRVYLRTIAYDPQREKYIESVLLGSGDDYLTPEKGMALYSAVAGQMPERVLQQLPPDMRWPVDPEKVQTGTDLMVKLLPDVQVSPPDLLDFARKFLTFNRLVGQKVRIFFDGNEVGPSDEIHMEDRPIGSIDMSGAKMDVYISKERNRFPSATEIIYSNNGQPQTFGHYYWEGRISSAPRVIVVDVISKSDSKFSRDYPWKYDRSGLRSDYEAAVKSFISSNLQTRLLQDARKSMVDRILNAPIIPDMWSPSRPGTLRLIDDTGELDRVVGQYSSHKHMKILAYIADTLAKTIKEDLLPIEWTADTPRLIGLGMSKEWLGLHVSPSFLQNVPGLAGREGGVLINPWEIYSAANAYSHSALMGVPERRHVLNLVKKMAQTLIHEYVHENVRGGHGEDFVYLSGMWDSFGFANDDLTSIINEGVDILLSSMSMDDWLVFHRIRELIDRTGGGSIYSDVGTSERVRSTQSGGGEAAPPAGSRPGTAEVPGVRAPEGEAASGGVGDDYHRAGGGYRRAPLERAAAPAPSLPGDLRGGGLSGPRLSDPGLPGWNVGEGQDNADGYAPGDPGVSWFRVVPRPAYAVELPAGWEGRIDRPFVGGWAGPADVEDLAYGQAQREAAAREAEASRGPLLRALDVVTQPSRALSGLLRRPGWPAPTGEGAAQRVVQLAQARSQARGTPLLTELWQAAVQQGDEAAEQAARQAVEVAGQLRGSPVPEGWPQAVAGAAGATLSQPEQFLVPGAEVALLPAVGKGLSLAKRALPYERAMREAERGIAPAAQLLGTIGRRGLPTRMLEAASSRAEQLLSQPGATAATVAAGALAGGAAATAVAQPQEAGQAVLPAAIGAGLGVLGGLGGSALLRASAKALNRLAVGESVFEYVPPGYQLPPILRRAYESLDRAQRVQRGLAPVPVETTTREWIGAIPATTRQGALQRFKSAQLAEALRQRVRSGQVPATYYPGGRTQLFIDTLREGLTDFFAPFETFQNWMNALSVARFGRQLQEHERVYDLLRLMPGVQKRADAFFVYGIRPIFERAGVTADMLPDFERLWRWRVEWERAMRGHATGELYKDVPRKSVVLHTVVGPRGGKKTRRIVVNNWARIASEEFRKEADLLTAKYGDPSLVRRWEGAMDALTEQMNSLVREAESVGLLAPGQAQWIISQHDQYAFVRNLESQLDSVLRTPQARQRYLTTTSGIGLEHTGTELADVSLAGMRQRVTQLLTYIHQNQIARGLVRWRQLSPGIFGEGFMRAPDSEFWTGSMQVPRGWGLIPVVEQGKMQLYIVPDWARDILLGSPAGVIDIASLAAGRMSAFFRAAVTSYSLYFFARNVTRDLEAMLQNAGFNPATTPILREYLAAWAEILTDPLLGEPVRGLVHRVAPAAAAGVVGAAAAPGEAEDKVLAGALSAFAGLGAARLAHLERLPIMQGLEQAVEAALKRVASTSPPLGKTAATLLKQPAGGRYLEEMYRKGMAGMGTFAEQLESRKGVEKLLGYEGAITLSHPLELVRLLSEMSETAPRLAVYRLMRRTRGASPKEAGMAARAATTDFSKVGRAMRVLNLWLPLLNARIQGSLRSAKALVDDPQGYLTRVALTVTAPTVITWAWNRRVAESFGLSGASDLYSNISPEVKDRNHVVIYGAYTDPETGDLQARYAAIAKDPVSSMFSTPLEHFLDRLWNTSYAGVPLEPEQRTERSWGQMIADALLRLLPIDLSSQDLADPLRLGLSAFLMSPATATAIQLAANRDYFLDRPIVQEEQLRLPPRYQLGRAGWTGRLLSDALEAVSPGEWTLAPAAFASAARSLGGTVAEMLFGAGDVLFSRLEKAGLLPPLRPQRLEDLNIPPGVDPQSFLAYVQRRVYEDQRPILERMFPAILKAYSRSQTPMKKVLRSGTKEDRRTWEDTVAVASMQNQWVQTVYLPRRREILDTLRSGKMTHGEANDRLSALDVERRGHFDGLAQGRFVIRDPAARQAFIDRWPGIPLIIRRVGAQASLELPPDVSLEQLAERYWQPPGVDLSAINPIDVEAARRREAVQMANELTTRLGRPIDPRTLEAHILATTARIELPVVTLPALHIERAVNEYLSPPGIDPRTVTPEELRRARRLVISRLAREWADGLPGQSLLEKERALLEHVNARLLDPDEVQDPDDWSRHRAYALSLELRDPVAFPAYVTREGAPMGSPEQWQRWDAALAAVPASRRSALAPDLARFLAGLDAARRRAQLRQLEAKWRSPWAADYERWFGGGRDLSAPQWQLMLAGKAPKYLEDGAPVPYATAQLWDRVVAYYRTLPDVEPERSIKERLRPVVRAIMRKATPLGKAVLLLDDLTGNRLEYEEQTGEFVERTRPLSGGGRP